jgi:hypothetical protein
LPAGSKLGVALSDCGYFNELCFFLLRKNMMVTTRAMMMASKMAIGKPIAKP